MRPRISIRGFVRPSVGPSVGRSVGRSVTLELKTIANDRKVDFIILGSDLGLVQCLEREREREREKEREKEKKGTMFERG